MSDAQTTETVRLRLSNNQKRKIRALFQQANDAFAIGRYDICEHACQKIDQIQTGLPNVYCLRGIMAAEEGKLKTAKECFERGIAIAPNKVELHENLARLYAQNGHPELAVDHYRAAMRCKGKTLGTTLSYVDALNEVGACDEVIALLNPLRIKHPKNRGVLMGLYQAHLQQGQLDRAHAVMTELLSLHHDFAQGHLMMALLLGRMGQMKEAEREFDIAGKLDPNHALIFCNKVELKKYRDREDPDIVNLQRLYEERQTESEERKELAFSLGKVMHDIGDSDRAFAYWQEGNAIQEKQRPFNTPHEIQHLQMVMDAYRKEVFDHCSNNHDSSSILVTGMPRCGSTLTEQILASHPDVASKGECNFLEGIALARCHTEDEPLTLENIVAFTPDEWGGVADTYLEFMKHDVANAQLITDKTLNNFRLLGAFHCALPQAKIIHVQRNPLDTCLSIYRNNLAGELFGFGRNLGGLGRYYRMYQQVMEHWRQVLPAGVMYEIDYEALVANPEVEARKLLDFCGLEWDDRCLEFYKAKNSVNTTSFAQVRRPMYRDSVAGWRRYEKQLEPLINILGTGDA